MKAVALKEGFYKGNRIRKGAEFDVDGKMPSWAAPKDAVKTLPTGTPVRMGDTKPKAAREAVKVKAAGINDVAGDLA